MSNLRIAYLSSADPNDKQAWSGIHAYLSASLEKHCGAVIPLGPWQPESLLKRDRVKAYLRRRITGKRTDYLHSIRLANAYGAHFTEKLRRTECDCIFAVAASTELAFTETKLPVYYVADATFANMVNYYPFYTGLSQKSLQEGHEIQKRALEKCTQLFFPSTWAADSAMKDYGIPASKIHVIPLGANVENVPEVSTAQKNDDVVRLLFIGVEWERKGGPVVVDAFHELLRRGVNAQLTILGSSPTVNHERITIIPYLNKNVPEQREKLNALFAGSDFFVLPTTAECYGLVFCEASAFGVPSLAPDTGGVSGAVRNGVNGFLLPEKSTGANYATKIMELLSNKTQLHSLRQSSLELYRTELNWDAWGTRVQQIISATQPR